jgi:uncharacterized protein YifE (UPF0438 family)
VFGLRTQMPVQPHPALPPDHEALWNRSGYRLGVKGVFMFTERELGLLQRRGHWLEGLDLAAIAPVTVAQERFVKVCRGELRPETEFERAWMKLKGRREFESEPRAEVDIFEPGERWNPRHENWRYNQDRYP